jgi:hypothetical protein
VLIPKIESWQKAILHFTHFLSPQKISGPFFSFGIPTYFVDPFSRHKSPFTVSSRTPIGHFWESYIYLLNCEEGDINGPLIDSLSHYLDPAYVLKSEAAMFIDDPIISTCLPYMVEKSIACYRFASQNNFTSKLILEKELKFTTEQENFIFELHNWDFPINYHKYKFIEFTESDSSKFTILKKNTEHNIITLLAGKHQNSKSFIIGSNIFDYLSCDCFKVLQIADNFVTDDKISRRNRFYGSALNLLHRSIFDHLNSNYTPENYRAAETVFNVLLNDLSLNMHSSERLKDLYLIAHQWIQKVLEFRITKPFSLNESFFQSDEKRYKCLGFNLHTPDKHKYITPIIDYIIFSESMDSNSDEDLRIVLRDIIASPNLRAWANTNSSVKITWKQNICCFKFFLLNLLRFSKKDNFGAQQMINDCQIFYHNNKAIDFSSAHHGNKPNNCTHPNYQKQVESLFTGLDRLI